MSEVNDTSTQLPLRHVPQQCSTIDRRLLQDQIVNLKLKELEHQQLQLQKAIQNSKDIFQSSHEVLLSHFDALENYLTHAPRARTRLPHMLTVSSCDEASYLTAK